MTEDNIYAFDDRNNYFYAVDKASGAIKWKFEARNGSTGGVPFIRGTPLVLDEYIFFGDYGNIYSLNKNSGQTNWIFTLGQYNRPSSFTEYNGNVIVIAENEILMFDPVNGNQLYRKSLPKYIISSPFLYNNKLYVGSIGNGEGTILAIDPNTGTILWEKQMPNSIPGSPIVFEDKLYFADQGGILYCFDTNSETLLWKMTVGDYMTTTLTFVKGNSDQIVYPSVIGLN